MSRYYLMAQLPALDGLTDSSPAPITEERFFELCDRLLTKKAAEEVRRLTINPPRIPDSSPSPLVDRWNEGERALRLALAAVRAEKLGKVFDGGDTPQSPVLTGVAKAAIEASDPMEAERILCRYRLDFLESLRPGDAFSEDAVFHYGLKLKLILRTRQFDPAAGEAAYRRIYDSVMNGDKREAVQ